MGGWVDGRVNGWMDGWPPAALRVGHIHTHEHAGLVEEPAKAGRRVLENLLGRLKIESLGLRVEGQRCWWGLRMRITDDGC